MAIIACPDDAKFLCAGAPALLHHHGWEIHIATVTAGERGPWEPARDEITSTLAQTAMLACHASQGA